MRRGKGRPRPGRQRNHGWSLPDTRRDVNACCSAWYIPDRGCARRPGARPAGPAGQIAHRSRPGGVGPTSLVLFPRSPSRCHLLGATRYGRRAGWRCRHQGRGGAPVAPDRAGQRQAGRLTRPAVGLRVDAQGRRSWDLALAHAAGQACSRPRAATDGCNPRLGRKHGTRGTSRSGGNLAATLEMFRAAFNRRWQRPLCRRALRARETLLARAGPCSRRQRRR